MRKRRTRDSILIDLTPLLDIIFIVLLVIVCQLQSLKNTAADDTAAAQDLAMEAETAQEMYEDQLESMEHVSDYVVFITVSAPYSEDLVTRHIYLLNSGSGDDRREITEIRGTDVAEGFSQLENELETYIKGNTGKTIVLALSDDGERILYRDRKTVLEIFERLKAAYSNVQLR